MNISHPSPSVLRLSSQFPPKNPSFGIRSMSSSLRMTSSKVGDVKDDNAILNPISDKTFKHLFGSIKNEEISKKFISDITGFTVESITFDSFLPPEDTEDSEESRRIVDIVCELPSGEKVLIEIRRASHLRFPDLIVHHAAKIYSSDFNLERDWTFSSLKNVYLIVISDDGPNTSKTDYSSVYRFMDAETEFSIDILTIHFLNLDKFPFKQDEAEKLKSPTDAWVFFLKCIHQLSEPEVDSFMKKYPFMIKPFSALKLFKLSKTD